MSYAQDILTTSPDELVALDRLAAEIRLRHDLGFDNSPEFQELVDTHTELAEEINVRYADPEDYADYDPPEPDDNYWLQELGMDYHQCR